MASTMNLIAQKLFDFSGKVALVTGGGSGTGLMIAQALAANGAKVYICGRTKEKVDKAAQAHGGQSVAGEIIPLQADINSKEGIKSLVDDIKSREKCLCILVNNAGISSPMPARTVGDAQGLMEGFFEQASFDEWISVYRTNVVATYMTTAAFLPLLQASTERHPGWSSTVINISSIGGLVHKAPNCFVYDCSKAAVEHLTPMLASDVATAKLRIRINSIAPGLFPSELTAGGSDDAGKSRLDKSVLEGAIPANRPGKDEDLAQTILFAAGNQYLNGQSLVVDGGMVLQAGR